MKVSIVMPVFAFVNPQIVFLEEAIQSVLVQTHEDWELIIVDDGSQIEIEKAIPKDKRIKLYKKKHEGIAKARNYGIKKMTGDVYMAHDADDVSSPERLESLLEALKDGDVVYSSFYHASMEKAEMKIKKAKEFDFEKLKKDQYIPYFVMVKKDKMVPYRDRYTANDDWMFVLDLANSGAKFVKVDEPLMIYRRNPMSVSVRSMYDGRKIREIKWIKEDIKKL